jgi:hypothetical protein
MSPAATAKVRDLERQQANVVKELREYQPSDDEDIDQQWRGQLRDSFVEIAAQRKRREAQVAAWPHGRKLAGAPSQPEWSN